MNRPMKREASSIFKSTKGDAFFTLRLFFLAPRTRTAYINGRHSHWRRTHTPHTEFLNWVLQLYWSVQQHGTLQDRHQELPNGDFPGRPMVRNLPSNAGGTRVQPLVGEDPTCCGANKPVSHKYRSLHSRATAMRSPHTTTREKPEHRNKVPAQPQIISQPANIF